MYLDVGILHDLWTFGAGNLIVCSGLQSTGNPIFQTCFAGVDEVLAGFG